MFFYHPTRRPEPTELEGMFTAEESAQISGLRVRFLAYPDHFKLGIDYRRLEFARWLVEHGRIGEWCEQPDGQFDSVQVSRYRGGRRQ